MENIAGGQFKAEVLSPPIEDRLLDSENPIDKEVLQYINQIKNDTTPSQSEQQNLLKSIHQKNKAAQIDLIKLNKGIIASLAFALNTADFDNTRSTIPAGLTALLRASASYDLKNSKISFMNYAIPQIHQAMEAVAPSIEAPYVFDKETPPLYTIYIYLSTLKKKPTAEPENADINESNSPTDESITPTNPVIDQQLYETDVYIEDEDVLRLTPLEKKIISCLHLPKSEIMQETNMPNARVQMIINRLIRQTNTTNREGLALYLYTNELIATVPAPNKPFGEQFSLLQIQILQNLQFEKREIAIKFNIPEDLIASFIRDALIATGARTKTELIMMTQAHIQSIELTNIQLGEKAS